MDGVRYEDALIHTHDWKVQHVKSRRSRYRKIVGCHCLHCMHMAVASGVVVAGVDTLPDEDGLPRGVYGVRLSWRQDVEIPKSRRAIKEHRRSTSNNRVTTRGRRRRQSPPRDTTGSDEDTEQSADVDAATGRSGGEDAEERQSTENAEATRRRGGEDTADTVCRCIKPETPRVKYPKWKEGRGEVNSVTLKFKPTFKTVFNPEIWTDALLEEKLKEAFNNIQETLRDEDEDKVKWVGSFDFEGNKYEFEGHYELKKESKDSPEIKVIQTFYFRPTSQKRSAAT